MTPASRETQVQCPLYVNEHAREQGTALSQVQHPVSLEDKGSKQLQTTRRLIPSSYKPPSTLARNSDKPVKGLDVGESVAQSARRV